MSDFKKVLNTTAFRNEERWLDGKPLTGGKPNFSNSTVKITEDIKAGNYSIAIWQYEDSGNLSFSLTVKDGQKEDTNNVLTDFS